MRILKKVLKVIGALLLFVVALVAFLLWWTHPKRPVNGAFVREAGPGVFKFTDIPKGRALSPEEVEGYARKLLGGDDAAAEGAPDVGRQLAVGPDQARHDREGQVQRLPDHGGRGHAPRHTPDRLLGRAARRRAEPLDRPSRSRWRGARAWDRDLQKRVGDAVGKEIRAQGGNLWGGVCVNLLRHPSWGRAQETLGEDPYLLGEMAVAAMEACRPTTSWGAPSTTPSTRSRRRGRRWTCAWTSARCARCTCRTSSAWSTPTWRPS